MKLNKDKVAGIMHVTHILRGIINKNVLSKQSDVNCAWTKQSPLVYKVCAAFSSTWN